MTIWAWLQPVEKIWKVVSEPEKGMITVHNEKDIKIMEKKGLSKEAVSLIEENFLEVVATRLTDKKNVNITDKKDGIQGLKKSIQDYNYMYA